MEYGDDLVLKIASTYSNLRISLYELEEIKQEGKGAVLGHVAEIYTRAEKSLVFLQSESVSPILQVAFKLGDLERKLLEFGNVHVNL